MGSLSNQTVGPRGLTGLQLRAFRLTGLRPTPVAGAMVLLLLVSGALTHLNAAATTDVIAWTSTNVHNLAHHPVASMVGSIFVVRDDLLLDVGIVAISLTALERAVGSGRALVIALSGQVISTLLTEYGAALGARWHLLADSSPDRIDVGVSYLMFAVVAAALMSQTGRIRFPGMLILSAFVLIPLLVEPGMTATGHVLSVAVGGTAVLLPSSQSLRRSRLPQATGRALARLWAALSRGRSLARPATVTLTSSV